MAFLNVKKWRKPTKTISGVSPLAVMLPPRKCRHGTCVYCPTLDAPQSYTPQSPAVLHAASLEYDPYKQVISRLDAFKAMRHPTDKIEIIIMGGTFLSFPLKFQYDFIKKCYDALNCKVSKTLEDAKKLNEHAKHRCVALCIETRPDICGKNEIKRMLEFGATRCELGVQAIDDKIYKIVNRCHTVSDVIKATKLLKDAGFKVGYHIMPGLPGSNPKKDFEMFKHLFSNSDFKPDQIKIYPTQVICGSGLEKWFETKKYIPYNETTMIELITKMKRIVPEYCRIMRIMREIQKEYITAGTVHLGLRKTIQEKMRKEGKKCNCIRCREIGFVQRDSRKEIDDKLKLKKTEYQASNGNEIFLQIVNKDNIIFGLCRLRIPSKPFMPEMGKKTLIIRELHVFGPQAEIGRKGRIQHRGLGAWLMNEAEDIARELKINKIAVISGIGVREYYACKFGYVLEGDYMVKKSKNLVF
jgi:elongator complex protein 3